ncbi:hypothetical protein [Celeribacter halophilus]|uniref:hypothetical protein n=1 Tax=Celeribacter halophilus TaxID=576117 RepID=UPI003A921EC5
MTNNADNTRAEIEEIRSRIDKLRDAVEIELTDAIKTLSQITLEARAESKGTQMVLGTLLGHIAANKDDPQGFILRFPHIDEATDVRDEQGAQFESLANGYQQAKAQIEQLALEAAALNGHA